jgi:hypothetical protein
LRPGVKAITTRDELHHLVDALNDAAADELLEYAHWLLEPTDTATPEELARIETGKAELARGEYVTLEELRRKLDL